MSRSREYSAMPLERPTSKPRTRIERDARFNVRRVQRTVGEEIGNTRQDVGVSLSRLAAEAGVSKGYLHQIESGDASPSVEVLARIAAALGGRIAVQYHPGTGPAIRDHPQAAIIEAFLAILHARWRRFLEVGVYRPVRGVIDLVLDEPEQGVLIASEAQSELRRLEQQVRWATAKADALAAGGSSELAGVVTQRRVSRLLLLRSTTATRELARLHPHILGAAYPATHEDALASLTGTRPWPGAAVLWVAATGRTARVLDRPPRGIHIGRA